MIEAATVEQSAGELEPEAAPVLSVLEHAKQFSAEAQQAEKAQPETAEEKAEREHHSALQRREKESGKFTEGKKRHRAASQQATAEDAPRIQALTSRAKTAEERVQALEGEVQRLRASGAPQAQVARAEARVEQAEAKVDAQPARSTFAEPEPDENDPKFGGDYGKFLRAASAWEGRKAYHDERQSERDTAAKHARAEADRGMLKTWQGRVEAAKGKHEDFESIAFAPTKIKEGSPADAFIMEDDNGPDVLYHLQSHPQDLDALLEMPVLKQLKALSLLSQRFASSDTSTAAGATGSAPGRRAFNPPPKPPNPVRTEAQSVSDGPPPTDGTLSVLRHAKAFKRS